MAKEFNTLEDAREEILRLQEELTERTNERDTLSQNNNTLTEELEKVRKLNQKYFNKLSAQNSNQEEEEEEEEGPPFQTCEDFAKTLNIL